MSESVPMLAYWINERQRIYMAKNQGKEAPWSEDPVFQSTYFTNVHREDDKVTRWIREHWPHDDVGLVVLARMFNLPSHLELLVRITHDWNEMKWESKQARKDGEKLFNGAYLITTCGVKMDKVDYVYRVAGDANTLNFSGYNSLDRYHMALTCVSGLGDFLAAQVVADLKNTQGHPLQSAPDWWTWCAPGPGSLKGIRCVTGFESVSKGQFNKQAAILYGLVLPLLDRNVGPLHMQDFQNCLCEFSKYVRVQNGGRSKRKYNGNA